ncbi:recombinase family protein, partial [Frankia canadensis]|uniref:recombinase family protein n=1 Tax=Frankia canadensis TaxID=1836972 RepID=UPI0014022A63
MNLKEWAAVNGVGYSTSRQWFLDGKLPVPARRVGGLILVDEPVPAATGLTAVYARVSSADQKPDLDRQVARVVTWAAGQGLPVGRVVTEVDDDLVRDITEILTSMCA